MDAASAPRRWASRAVTRLLGLVLLTAAGLKLAGLGVWPFAQYGLLSLSWVQMAAVEWEVVLGVWLLSGQYRAAAWPAAAGTFLVFAGVSGYLGVIGQATCGCFGALRASPWAAFGVDAAALVLLAATRPSFRSGLAASANRNTADGLLWVGGLAVLLAGLTAAGVLWVGSPEAAMARLRDESVGVAEPYLDFGEGRPGDSLMATAVVHNWTDRPIQLVGGTSDCSCTTVDDLPTTVGPAEVAAVRIRLTVPRSGSGQLTRSVYLRTDCPGQPVVRFRIGCRVE